MPSSCETIEPFTEEDALEILDEHERNLRLLVKGGPDAPSDEYMQDIQDTFLAESSTRHAYTADCTRLTDNIMRVMTPLALCTEHDVFRVWIRRIQKFSHQLDAWILGSSAWKWPIAVELAQMYHKEVRRRWRRVCRLARMIMHMPKWLVAFNAVAYAPETAAARRAAARFAANALMSEQADEASGVPE